MPITTLQHDEDDDNYNYYYDNYNDTMANYNTSEELRYRPSGRYEAKAAHKSAAFCS
jgi:hypothetical protein